MEDKLLEVANYAMKQPDVIGYMCVDNNGLCLVATGQATEPMSGIVQHLTQLVSNLEPEKPKPTMKIRFNSYKLTIQSQAEVTVGLLTT